MKFLEYLKIALIYKEYYRKSERILKFQVLDIKGRIDIIQ